jgi:hypothetical protein
LFLAQEREQSSSMISGQWMSILFKSSNSNFLVFFPRQDLISQRQCSKLSFLADLLVLRMFEIQGCRGRGSQILKACLSFVDAVIITDSNLK